LTVYQKKVGCGDDVTIRRHTTTKENTKHQNLIVTSSAADKEKFIRLLLLTAFLGQQADSLSARSTGIKIHQIFGDDLFSKPKIALNK